MHFSVEPFGILQFLQALLPQTPNATAPINDETTAQTATPVPTDESVNEPKTQSEQAQDAFLRFLQAHDNRAKRTKKQ